MQSHIDQPMDKQTIKQMYKKQTDIWIKKQMTDGQENPLTYG